MNVIEIEDKFYILATSSYADDRTNILKQGESFGVFDRFGDIHQIGTNSQGLYHEDTRFLSEMHLSIENKRPLLLSSTASENNEVITTDLTNPDFPDGNGEMILHGTIHILRKLFIMEGATYQKISFKNFGENDIHFDIKFGYGADYADIFEVRGTPRDSKGEFLDTEISSGEVLLGYMGLDDICRQTRINFEPAPDTVEEKESCYKMSLAAKEVSEIVVKVTFILDHEKKNQLSYDAAVNVRHAYNVAIKKNSVDIYTSNEQFNDWLNRSKADMATMVSETPQGLYPYAGIPWYSTPFGRDGIITAFECLWVEPLISQGVLKYLAFNQATEIDDFRDAQPGKILHETRDGEMAHLNEVPFKQYYGSIDSTPLFVCLAGAYFERTGDLETITDIWENIEKAVNWIDEYGDIDNDGFLEYATKSSKGLVNQGWKDSFDSIFYEDGRLAKGPIALCEVQGYVYEAKLYAGKIASVLGHSDKAEKWTQEARDLKVKFNEVFWSESKNCFYLALDGEKQPCNVLASNAGHCLFSGIADEEKARKAAKSLTSEEMFSGWGIRTLSSKEERYNPMSYHNGSVWPHDNAMIAYGFSRYGLQRNVQKILSGMFDTSMFEENQRLPELFCGFNRRKGHGPTAYPVACSPQAWAVGAVFLILQSVLGIEIDAANKQINLYNPELPPYLSEITIRNLKIGDKTVALQIRKKGEEVQATNLSIDSEVKVKIILDEIR